MAEDSTDVSGATSMGESLPPSTAPAVSSDAPPVSSDAPAVSSDAPASSASSEPLLPAATAEAPATSAPVADGDSGAPAAAPDAAGAGEAKAPGWKWRDALLPLQAGLQDFDYDAKHHSKEDQSRWRKMSLVRNAARRFRYTHNITQPDPRESVANRLRVGASAIKAVTRFKSVLSRISDAAVKAARAEGFGLSAKQLEGIMSGQDATGLQNSYGGVEGIARRLDADLRHGITATEADIARRVKTFGTNTYPEKPPKAFLEFVWDAMQDMTLWILAVCAVFSLLVGIVTEGWQEGWYDGAGILLSILLVVFVTATSDYRQSLQFRLLDAEKKKVTVEVLRGGVRQALSVFDLVVGDVIVLSTGDIVPADALLIQGHSLVVDESSMTGESVPAYKGKEAPFFLAGTKVQDGHGTVLATGVGMHTEWGQLMAKLTDSGDDETPLQVKLSGVATLIGRVGLYVALLVFFVLMYRLLRSTSLWDWSFHHTLEVVHFFAIAVTIVVVAVPEGLPLAVTLSLAFAMKKMMRDKALVRKLAACETMGSATTICSDKTGTLTANQMTVVQAWITGSVHVLPPQDPTAAPAPVDLSLPEALRTSLLLNFFLNTSGDVQLPPADAPANSPPVLLGTPTEQAMLALGLRLGGEWAAVRSSVEVLKLQPFNSQRKRMGAVVRLADGTVRALWKGAAEIVLGTCTQAVSNEQGEVVPLDPSAMDSVVLGFADNALRTLTLAYRDLQPGEIPEGGVWGDRDEIPDNDLILQAVVGIKDPLRAEVPLAVQTCKTAGIVVRMVTGDNLNTAIAIARECGILTETGEAIEGPKFRQLSKDQMMALLPRLQVMARSSPTDKHTLVSVLREMGEVVAVTGDGTNDAPALKEADIGLAMGIAGTEVAKESADVIVMDDNFSSVVNVAKWGRSVYANIQKFVQFQLTVNIVALVTNFVSACTTGSAPLTAVQLLWVNLIMDTLGALALATEPPDAELMKVGPVGRRAPFISAVMWRNIACQAVFQLLVLGVIMMWGKWIFGFAHAPDAPQRLDTIVFNTFVFCQLFNEVNSREMERMNVLRGMEKNVIFLGILLASTAFQILLVQVLGKFASTVPLTPFQFIACIVIASLSLPVAVAGKMIELPKAPVKMLQQASLHYRDVAQDFKQKRHAD
ncbi:unnamed protein product [Closterium sp. Naga37s-1]|nr:unnamed protein product [Closterium sp. Naga37s-1]